MSSVPIARDSVLRRLGKKRMAFENGAVLQERYKIRRCIDIGGASEIYLAEDKKRQNRAVVVKTPWVERSKEPPTLHLFKSEIAALAMIDHKGVVKILDAGDAAEAPFMVLEYLGGKSRLLEDTEISSVGDLFKLLYDICDALDAVHQRGIVHRDIKPGNIFRIPDGVKLIDFQYAKVPIVPDYAAYACHPIGSPEFMAPEQTYHTPSRYVDHRADIYALGGTMYMLAGRTYSYFENHPLPFAFRSSLEWPDFVADCIKKHRTEKPIPLYPRFDRAPPRLSEILLKALEKDPEKRFQTVLEIKEALKTCRQ